MPAKYFPSLSQNGIDMNTMPNLSEVFTAPRGQDPMHYGFMGSKGPQSPFAPMVGQAADALMDPRLGMLPMGAGFRAVGQAGRTGSKMVQDFAKRGLQEGESHYIAPNIRMGMNMEQGTAGVLESAPSPYQQATTMRQPQGDQSMGKAITDLAASMGWSSEKMADWLVQNGFRSGR